MNRYGWAILGIAIVAGAAGYAHILHQWRSEYTILDVERDVLEQEYNSLEQGYNKLVDQANILRLEVDTANSENTGLRIDLWNIHRGANALREENAALAAEVRELREAFELANLPTPDKYVTSGVSCTGSMDPLLTCFDTVTEAVPLSPSNIQVGTIIVTPYCDDAEATFNVIHRVVQIRSGEDATPEYLTRGDNNSADDSCWTPYASVLYYVISIQKAEPELGMVLLASIWAMEEQAELTRMLIDEKHLKMEKFLADDRVGMYNGMVPDYNSLFIEYYAQLKEISMARAVLQDLKDRST